jgi:hypothetical protein
MVEQSKFAGALGRLNKRPTPPGDAEQGKPEQPPVMPVKLPPSTPEPTGKTGRGGKRSDPAYSPTTFFVRKETKRKAARLLEDSESENDLSDLVEELLSKWVSEHSNA